ncbi:MAG: class I SAM-dependent methyltransferase [Alphaproteobacteria bacterium]|nr:class I SAM-dependent methyltransferase [Alphaproteobacteria bacterium]TAD88080.1 MAG: class I SAM-dependent methyltransferase [Alphaproteobacteria bacterium]
MDAREYEKMAAVEAQMWWYQGLHQMVLTLIDGLSLRPGARVLDAGCGTGGLLARIAERRPDLRLTGFDFDDAAVAWSRRKAAIPLVAASINALPFASGQFEAVVSCDVLCHRSVDQAAALADIARVLAPGGHVILNLPAYDWMYSTHDRRVHTARRYTVGRARQSLAEHGLRVSRGGYWNTGLFPLMAVHRLLSRSSSGDSDVHLYPAPIEALFRRVVLTEAWLVGKGVNLPYGGSVLVVAEKVGHV